MTFPRMILWGAFLLLALLPMGWGVAGALERPSLPVDILDRGGKTVGKALIFSNFIELMDGGERKKGAVGVVIVQGRMRLFLVGPGQQRTLVGWAENNRLFDSKGKLVGFYNWTPIWSYVYDKSMNKVGRAQCLAYQGVCAAGVAGFLLGLFP